MTEELKEKKTILDKILDIIFAVGVIVFVLGVFISVVWGSFYVIAFFYWPWLVSEFQLHQSIAISRAIVFLGLNLVAWGILLFVLVVLGVVAGEDLGLVTVHPADETPVNKESQKED